ncbi:MAG: hypothetical protein KKD18_04305 [Nanoarchaeota archaeon]|nr:hypothetical protein [Nanoarchaeota archaeon]
MEKLGWMLVALGVIFIVAASFAFSDPSLSHGIRVDATDFQIILALGGLAAVIVGIIQN